MTNRPERLRVILICLVRVESCGDSGLEVAGVGEVSGHRQQDQHHRRPQPGHSRLGLIGIVVSVQPPLRAAAALFIVVVLPSLPRHRPRLDLEAHLGYNNKRAEKVFQLFFL